MRRASAGSEASALCSFVALIFLLSSAADQRAVHCQSHFRPMNQHQNLPPSQGLFVGQSPRLGPQLQQIGQRQVRSQQALLPRPSAGLPPWPQQQQIAGRSVSDRRASSDAVQFAQNSLAQQVPTRAPALAGSSTIKQGNLQDQPQFHFHEQNGKLLICYYTTKQTAPYWPKDSREFVIPASRLEQAASEFLRANSDAGQKFLAPQANIGAADSPAMFGLDQAKQVNQQQRRSVFAGGRRLVVVAPEFVPFNQSLMMAGGAIGNLMMARPTSELGRDQRPDSLAQMFFMANNRRKTIADRQDNGATITSGSITTNQSYVAPQLAQFVSANNEQASRGSNVIVFERNKSKNDLSNRHVGGPNEAGQQQQQRPANSNTQLSPQMQQSTGASAATAVSAPVPRLPGRNGNAREMSAHFADNEQLPAGGNSRDHLEGAAKARQELQLSPGLGRAFIVGTTIATAPSSSSASAPNYAVEDKQEQPSNSLYYYYNVPTGSTSQQPTLSAVPSAPTTVTFGASNSFRPAGLVQQQHHELSGATLAGFNSNGIPQRAPSSALPMPIENELGMQQVSQSPSSPGGLVPMSATSPQAAPTSYLISGATQSQRPNGLIVSDALSALTTAPSTQQQQARYTNSPSLLKSNYLFKSATSLAAGAADASSAMAASPTTPVVVQTIMQSATARPTAGPSAALQSKLDEPATSRPQHQQQAPQHHNGKLTVGLGGGSLSAALVSSPLSTMFDVFGAASQYLMRFKPSSLISPASLAAFNSIGSALDHANLHAKLKPNSSSLVSLPAGQQQQQRHASGAANGSASSLAGGFLTRLSLQHNQRREDICGRTIQTPERRIIGGEGAKYGEFPYQVHIKIAKHQCGGALIDKQSIVTAAHCVYHFITRAPVSKLQIVIGAYDIEDEQYQELPPQYFKVNKVKLHPNFRFSASHPDRYDIAILKLDKPVKYTDNVLPVCLPGKDLKYENMVGTVTGFGKTDPSLSNRYGTRLLQKVDVPIIENSECERWHRTRGIDLKIFPEMMCAGYEDGLKDACVGDSGGPLVVKTPAGNDGQSFRWTLAGITSAGFGCAQSRQPGIYHRVSHTVDWILENID